MSLGFPAFFRQFWLHLRKNLRKNLQKQTGQAMFEMNLHSFAVFVCRMHRLQPSLANKADREINISYFWKAKFNFLLERVFLFVNPHQLRML